VRRDVLVVLAASVTALLSASAADAATPDEERAEALFREGKTEYDAGRFDVACAKLAESDALDPAVGTLGMLAACEEKRGHIGQALTAYREVARRAGAADDPRGAFAERRAASLDPRVPRVVVEAPAGVRVLIDGKEVTARGTQQPLRPDPGDVVVEATRPDGSRWAHSYDLPEGAAIVVVIPELGSDPARPQPEPPRDHEEGGGPPVGAVLLGGVGVVGLGLMSGFGISAASRNARSEDLQRTCEAGDAAACASGEDERDAASSAATVATVSFGVGATCLAAGALWWFLDRPAKAPSTATVVVGPGDVGLGLARSF
jgi:hypothetical protein